MTISTRNVQITLRIATADDAPLILQFIRDLAEYERAPQAAVVTLDDLVRDGFGPHPNFRVLLAFCDGEPAAFALFFYNYSTWLGRPGIYLEDLFVRPRYREHGVGNAVMRGLARIALRENCYGIKWLVLDWNQLAIGFYEKLGSERQSDWLSFLIKGDALTKLAEKE